MKLEMSILELFKEDENLKLSFKTVTNFNGKNMRQIL